VLACLLGRASGWACDTAPDPACPAAAVHDAQLLLDNHLKPAPIDSRVIWHWKPFPALIADLGGPDGATSFELCIYDHQAGVPHLRFAFSIPAGGRCGDRPCWRRTPTGFAYRNRTGDPDGITVVQLQGNDGGRGEALIKGNGPQLPPFRLPLVQGPEVVAELRSSDGRCWTTHFHDASRNYRGQFMAKSE